MTKHSSPRSSQAIKPELRAITASRAVQIGKTIGLDNKGLSQRLHISP